MNYKKGFIDKYGREYSNIVVVDKNDLGKMNLVTATHCEDAMSEFNHVELENMITFLYKLEGHPNIAIRIFGDYGQSNFFPLSCMQLHCAEARFVSELQKRKSNIKLSALPYGIITNNGHVVGQIAPFINNCDTLKNCIKNGSISDMELLKAYRDILIVLKELTDNGIYYRDVHGGNIVFSRKWKYPRLIDFEDRFTTFDAKSETKAILINYFVMVNKLNKMMGINETITPIFKDSSIEFSDAFDLVNEMTSNHSKVLKR